MPRKPRTVYVLIDPPTVTGSQVPSIQAWKLEIQDGETPVDTLARNASLFPPAHTLITTTDIKTTSYTTTPQVTEVE